MTLKFRFFLWITGLITVVVIGMGVLSVMSERRLLRDQMNRHQYQTVQRLAKVCSETLYQSDLLLLNYFKTLSDEQGFLAASFVDSVGGVRVHSDPKFRGINLTSPEEATANRTEVVFLQTYANKAGSKIIDLAAPVYYGNERIGTARLFLSQDEINRQFNRQLTAALRRIAATTIGALALGFIGALILARTLVRPIHEIVHGMRRVSEGELEPVALSPRTDELGWLGREVNATIGKLKELDEMKRDFVAGVTHNLKSPLVALKGYLVMLTNGGYGKILPEQSDVFVTMQNNTSRLMESIDELLTSARIENGNVDVSWSRFDANELLNEIADLYRPLAKQKEIALRTEPAATAALVWGDREKTYHVLANLVSNALKFTKRGEVRITVQPQETAYRVDVADSGVGIPADEKKHLFEKFYRVKSTSRVAKGTGLGLFIVKGFVESQNGTVSVHDNDGGGTIVSFTLLTKRPNSEEPV